MDLSVFHKPSFNIHVINIHSYEVGCDEGLTIPSLLNYFQEIAWEHAGMLGFGMEDLQKDGLFWALARIRLEITNLPKWKDTVTLVTYPSGIDGLFAIRDYEMYDSGGHPLIMATSSWLILNHTNRKPIRTADYMKDRKLVDRRSTSTFASKIDSLNSHIDYSYRSQVKPYDIDVNNHVNNVRYIEWALNSYNFDFIKNNSPELIEVNFITEGMPDNQILIERININPFESIIKIKREDDSKELCRVYSKWKSKF